MKKKSTTLLIFTTVLAYAGGLSAQVGIGTSSPNASAQLEISSSSKGFLPPRVTLTGTADVTTIASPAAGLMVYNTATAGTSPNNVTPGIYYYDGAKWQRVINQQPDATVEFNTADPNSSSPSPTFTPNTPASKDYVYVSSVNNSQWTYNGTAYVTYTPPASTAWYTSGGTSDAGSNKTGSIYRTGKVGIGTSTPNSSLTVGTANGSVPGEITLNPSDGANEGGQINIKKSPNSGVGSDWVIDQFGTNASNSRIRIFNNTETNGMAILDNGNIGVGTITPSTKLHVAASSAGTGFRLVDGSQGANKVLQSDANGNASWATNVAVTPAVIGVMGSGSASTSQNAYTGAYITLPNGKWSVSVSMLAITSSSGDYWLRSGFSASTSTINLGADAVAGGPTLISGFVHGGGYYTMLNGTVIINNTSGANKTYYYCTGGTGVWNGGTTGASFTNLGRDAFGENSIVAYPMN
jgi:hypothetical protein